MFDDFSIRVGKKNNSDSEAYIRVPVRYADMQRMVAHILRYNSENVMNSCPFMSAYITNLQIARDRLQEPRLIDKVQVAERKFDTSSSSYTAEIGNTYTVERFMPVPYNLNMAVDIWCSNTDQKLQIMEQILYLFNPDFEIQKTDNYIDWTSLSYVELTGTTFSSRTIPVGADSEIDVATLTFSMPIWLSPPVKVKKLGVVQKIIMSIYDDDGGIAKGLIDGELTSRSYITPNNFGLLVTGNQLRLSLIHI